MRCLGTARVAVAASFARAQNTRANKVGVDIEDVYVYAPLRHTRTLPSSVLLDVAEYLSVARCGRVYKTQY